MGGGLTLAGLSDLVYCTPDAVFGALVARTVGHCESPDTMADSAVDRQVIEGGSGNPGPQLLPGKGPRGLLGGQPLEVGNRVLRVESRVRSQDDAGERTQPGVLR